MSKEKLERRKRMGDDPTAKTQSNTTMAGAPPSQPIPGASQGPGNIMNDPRNGFNAYADVGFTSPYGDDVLSPDARNKVGGVVNQGPVSGKPQGFTAGTLLNRNSYGMQPQPLEETARRLDSLHAADSAGRAAERLYGPGVEPSYVMGPLGMMGTPIEQSFGSPNPGQFPATMREQSNNQLDLRGMPDAQMAVTGMNTGRGGGRNQQKGAK